MPRKRKYIANFEARSVALFASLLIGGALGAAPGARAAPGVGAGALQGAPASQTLTVVGARRSSSTVTRSTDKAGPTGPQIKPSN